MRLKPQPPISRRTTYTVEVDDNYHYMDESERYTLGEYDTWEEALAAAKKVVDDFLDASSESGAKLYDDYVSFGEDPFISGGPPDGQESFSAWAYAKRRCEEIGGRR